MATFENYMTNYIFRQRLDPIRDAINGKGIAAKYYHRGAVKIKSSQCRIERGANGIITNKGRIVKMLLSKCKQFKLYALRLYVAGNIDVSSPKSICFSVIANLPAIFIDVEKSSHEEVMSVITRYDLLSKRNIKWLYDALTIGCFRLNEINAARYEVLNQLIDMISVFKYAFRFLNDRADHYFGNLPAAITEAA